MIDFLSCLKVKDAHDELIATMRIKIKIFVAGGRAAVFGLAKPLQSDYTPPSSF